MKSAIEKNIPFSKNTLNKLHAVKLKSPDTVTKYIKMLLISNRFIEDLILFHIGQHERKLVLLRHGESTWNDENRFTGWTDVDFIAERLRRG